MLTLVAAAASTSALAHFAASRGERGDCRRSGWSKSCRIAHCDGPVAAVAVVHVPQPPPPPPPPARAVPASSRGSTYSWTVSRLGVASRVAFLMSKFGSILATRAAIDLCMMPHSWREGLREWWWPWMLRAMREAGPCSIKLGQWAATRRDIFPQEMCDRLGVLQSEGARHSWEHTEQTLRDALGEDWQKTFDVDREPLGAGAVAQVHRARVVKPPVMTRLEKGQEVALKVVHKSVREGIRRDISVLRWLASWSEHIPGAKWMCPREFVEEFARLLESQVDMQMEAQATQQFARNFAQTPGIAFPHVYPEACTPQLLVESFCGGVPLKTCTERCEKDVLHELGTLYMSAFFRMLFEHNFIHADMHPGNVLTCGVKPSGQRNTDSGGNGQVQLVLLDAGLVTSLAPWDRLNFVDLFTAIAKGDGHEAGRLMIERSRDPKSCTDPEAFVEAIHRLVHNATTRGLSLNQVGVGELMNSVLLLCREHHVFLESAFASVVLSAIVADGVGRQLHPEQNLLRSVLPFALRAKAAMATSPAPVPHRS